jgi:SAM-dependent methyltransferase|tara:strand:- start:51 stop:719 length:669 start_codon:yes stop_codon:yes gene_type:complete
MKQKSTNRQIPWPNIRTDVNINNKQPVPLHEDYAMNDMWYLDTEEAYPLFEKQAMIIKDQKYKGIIDVGCRHGPVNKILQEDLGYTKYSYFGFDTSSEPIDIGTATWQNHKNINYKNISWNDEYSVDFKVDVMIFSGVLLYIKDQDERELFFKNMMEKHQCKNAIIQEPYHYQRYWDDRFELQCITKNGLDFLNTDYNVDLHYLDLPIFAGKRVLYDVSSCT